MTCGREAPPVAALIPRDGIRDSAQGPCHHTTSFSQSPKPNSYATPDFRIWGNPGNFSSIKSRFEENRPRGAVPQSLYLNFENKCVYSVPGSSAIRRLTATNPGRDFVCCQTTRAVSSDLFVFEKSTRDYLPSVKPVRSGFCSIANTYQKTRSFLFYFKNRNLMH